MLRLDGVLTLIEMTRNMFWLDIMVGLFEGWWLFKEGGTRAVTTELFWEKGMKKAEFKDVAWTDGSCPESRTILVIAGFPSASPDKSMLETKH